MLTQKKLKQTICGQESCFVLIPWMECNLMVTNLEVNTTKTISIKQPIQHIINPGQLVLIRSCLLVQSPIIYAHPWGSILFPSKKNGGPIRRGAGPNPALDKVLIQLFSDL